MKTKKIIKMPKDINYVAKEIAEKTEFTGKLSMPDVIKYHLKKFMPPKGYVWEVEINE